MDSRDCCSGCNADSDPWASLAQLHSEPCILKLHEACLLLARQPCFHSSAARIPQLKTLNVSFCPYVKFCKFFKRLFASAVSDCRSRRSSASNLKDSVRDARRSELSARKRKVVVSRANVSSSCELMSDRILAKLTTTALLQQSFNRCCVLGHCSDLSNIPAQICQFLTPLILISQRYARLG